MAADDSDIEDDEIDGPLPRGRDKMWAVRLKVNPDGSFSNPKFEQIVLLMADGLDELEAWLGASPGRKKAGTLEYRRRITRHPVFLERLRMLTEEKDEAYKDPLWGKAAWTIDQAYRHAVARNDLKAIMDCMKYQLRLAQDRAGMQFLPEPGETAGNEAQIPGKVGKPVAEHPQTRRTPLQIRAHLMRLGQSNEAEEAEDVS